jgi:hypothetical protein
MHPLYFIAAISLSGITAGKVAGIIASVYAILQVAKKTFPALTGKWALAINLGLSVGAVAIVLPPDKLFSMESFTALAIAGITAMGSAGIHGTVQNVAPAALQTVLGQGTKTDAPQGNSVAVAPTTAQSPTSKYNPD